MASEEEVVEAIAGRSPSLQEDPTELKGTPPSSSDLRPWQRQSKKWDPHAPDGKEPDRGSSTVTF